MTENGISLVHCMSPPIGEDPKGEGRSPFPSNYNTGMDQPQKAFLRADNMYYTTLDQASGRLI